MKQPYNTTIYNTALYFRLSRDDENYGDSVSLCPYRVQEAPGNQKQAGNRRGNPLDSGEDFRPCLSRQGCRRRERKNGTTQIFAGLIKCADCGWSLAYGENRQNSKPYGHYHCSKYGQGTRQCSMHYIRYDVLYAYVLSRLQYWSGLVQHDEERLLKRLLNASDKGQAAARKKQAAELKKAEKRKAEVDALFSRMYEDWAAGRITEYNFNMLSGKYQSEQAELDGKIGQLQAAIAAESQNAADAEKWIALMKKCVNPTELTAELLNTLIWKKRRIRL